MSTVGIGSPDWKGGIDIGKLQHGNGKGTRYGDRENQSVQNRKSRVATLRRKLEHWKSRLKRGGGARKLQVSKSVDIGWYSHRVGGTNGNSNRDRPEMQK